MGVGRVMAGTHEDSSDQAYRPGERRLLFKNAHSVYPALSRTEMWLNTAPRSRLVLSSRQGASDRASGVRSPLRIFGRTSSGDEEMQLACVGRPEPCEQALRRDGVLHEVDIAIEVKAKRCSSALPIATIAARSRSSPPRTIVIGAP